MDVRQQQQSSRPEPAPAPVARESLRVKSQNLNKVLYGLIGVLAALGIIGLLSKGFNAFTANQAVSNKEYQALFLTNGQVYFGKLSGVANDYVKLTDIYYLQVQQAVQPKDSSQQAQQSVSLAKLGGELHGPEDSMYVSRQQVLFWENMKDSGKVVTAIKEYQAKQKK